MANCEVLYHIAAHVGGWTEDPFKEVIDINCKASVDILKVAQKAEVRRVVFTSSTFAILDSLVPSPPLNGTLYTEEDWNLNVGEETARSQGKWEGNPWAAYGVSKTLAERAAWEYSKEVGLDLVVINPGVVFGPAIGGGGATVAIFTGSVKENNPIMNNVFHSVDVRDVARAHVAAAEIPSASGRYLCMQRSTAGFKEFADIITKAFPDMSGVQGADASQLRRSRSTTARCRHCSGANSSASRSAWWTPFVTSSLWATSRCKFPEVVMH